MNAGQGFSLERKRAAYASDPRATRGRLVPEPESPTRTPFQRDRDRIIHSAAFRRLKHKTQVFVYHEGDYYRTRLTHSLEVAQIARSLARSLGLDDDLAEALALAHDLGHTPFGHAGEEALADCMKSYGGFDHNGQTLRILTTLEQRYAEFDGLNLCWESLEGVVKHNGPLVDRPGSLEGLPWAVAEYSQHQDLELHTQPGAEAQIAALSDDIAYHAHDLDDGLRARLFGLSDLKEVPLVGPILGEIHAKYPRLQQTRLIHEMVRRLINVMVNDLLAETHRRLADLKPKSAEDVRALSEPVAAFSESVGRDNLTLKAFLYRRMYRHSKVNRMTSKARRVVTDLFGILSRETECLPEEWRAEADAADEAGRARLVADYIAGMTDRYALDEHRRMFDLYEENR